MAHSDSEPSVEEILASIKKVMAADQKAERDARIGGKSGLQKPHPDDKNRNGIKRGDDEHENRLDENESVLELGAFQHAASDDAEDDDAGGDASAPLIAKDHIDSVRSSLAALATLAEPGKAPQIVRSGETSLEGLVRDMMRPMLKEWLDQNLPDLVENMVASEIRRITRKGQ